MDTVEKFRRYLGVPIPYSMTFVVGVLGSLWEWTMKYFSEPEVLRRELAKRKEQYLEADRVDREELCDRLALKGKHIFEMRSIHGKYAWDKVLRDLRVSRRTAYNYVNLYLFSKNSPALYERFHVLGPTKLYRLARVAPERLRNFTLDTPVPTKDGMIPLGRATDVQLESFLKEVFPPKRRTQNEKLRDAAKRVVTLASRWPADEPLGGDTLEGALGAVRTAQELLAGLATDASTARRQPQRPGDEPRPAAGP